MVVTEGVLHAETSLCDYDSQTDEDRAEEFAIIEQGLADLHAGDKGMLLEDYRAEVMAKREARKHQRNAQAAA